MTRTRTRETDEYAAFCTRAVRALGRRVGDGDADALPLLAGVADTAEAQLRLAVEQLRDEPWSYSWAEIGSRLGITRQAAQQRFGR